MEDDATIQHGRAISTQALTALVISAGASKEYFAEGPARLTISRAAAAVARVDARGALLDLID